MHVAIAVSDQEIADYDRLQLGLRLYIWIIERAELACWAVGWKPLLLNFLLGRNQTPGTWNDSTRDQVLF